MNGYHIENELDDTSKIGYYKSILHYNNVDWFVIEIKKLKNKMNFYFNNTNRDVIITQEDEKLKNINICRFCEKNFESVKVKDQCYLIG